MASPALPDDGARARRKHEVAILLDRAGLPASDEETELLVDVYESATGMARQMYEAHLDGEIG